MSKKGFGKQKCTETHQTFRVEYKIFNPETGDEEDAENVLYKVPLRIGTAVERRHYIAAKVACYFESKEAKERGINVAFLFNSEAANFEPIGRLSSIPMPDAVTVDFQGLNAQRGLKVLNKKIVKELSK